jgi:hypothetical protein
LSAAVLTLFGRGGAVMPRMAPTLTTKAGDVISAEFIERAKVC